MQKLTPFLKPFLEIVVILAVTATYVHLTTVKPVVFQNVISAALILFTTAIITSRVLVKILPGLTPLLASLISLALGFWLFTWLRQINAVTWPIKHPSNVIEYRLQLYYHLILTLCVLFPALAAAVKLRLPNYLSFGTWRKIFPLSRLALWLGLVPFIGYAAFIVTSFEQTISEATWILLVMACCKAAMNSVTEEVAYRGLVQPAASVRYSTTIAIIFQALVYTLFHLNLGLEFFPRITFLSSVFFLGLLFGSIAHITQGIGWSIIAHFAIGVIVEWHLLSQ